MKTKNSMILTSKKIYILISILAFSVILTLPSLRNYFSKSSITESSTISISENKDESWTTSNGETTSNNHYLAYIKSNDLDIWLLDVNTNREFLAFPKIDKTYFCKEGCITRSFSFSPDRKKLIADLILSNGNPGFGYINLDDISQDNKIHFVRGGYRPFFNQDGNIVFFYDKLHYPRTLSYIDINQNIVVSVGEFRAVDWFSANELLLDSDKVQKEKATFYKYNTTNNSLTQIIVKDLYAKAKDVRPISLSPLKDLVLVKTYDGHDKLGVVKVDGSEYTPIGSDNSPYAAWSPDGKMIAIQNISIYYPRVSDNIQIISSNDYSIKKSINVDIGYSTTLCWLPSENGDLIIFTTKSEEIVLYNLKNDKTQSLQRDLYENPAFMCQ